MEYRQSKHQTSEVSFRLKISIELCECRPGKRFLKYIHCSLNEWNWKHSLMNKKKILGQNKLSRQYTNMTVLFKEEKTEVIHFCETMDK